MQTRELMTRDPHACEPGAPLVAAARLMWEFDIGAVPVVDAQRRLVGMVTDRDIAMAVYLQGRGAREIEVGEVMSTPVHAVNVGAPVQAAEAVMRRHQVRRVPVVDDDRRLVGILSLNDLALAQDDAAGPTAAEVAATLRAVCARRDRLVAA